MGSPSGDGRDHGRERTGCRPGLHQPDPDKPHQYRSNSNLYRYPYRAKLHREHIYPDGDRQPETGSNGNDQHHLQRNRLYSNPS